MGKCVLVMDMPDKCWDCPLCQSYINCNKCQGKDNLLGETYLFHKKPDWCPLKPLPKKQELTFHEPGQDAITMGWNACIEEIEGNLK